MESDENINYEHHDECEHDSAHSPDTLCPSRTGEAQEIPVVVVMPQDAPSTDFGEGIFSPLSVNDHKPVNLKLEPDEIIKPENGDEDDNDDNDGDDNDDNGDEEIDGDADTLEAELHIFENGSRKKRKEQASDENGAEARRSSREEILLGKIKLQKELMDKIRFQPWHIQKKLKLLKNAKNFLKGHQSKLSKRQDYHQKSIEVFRRLKRELINIMSLFIPWEMRIKKVESHFGSVVASYFLFLRWILAVNSLLTLLTVAFIIVPQITVGNAANVQIPHAETSKSKDLETLFNAEGVIKYSPFFYGYYENHVIGHGYMMPLAYLATGLVVYGLSIIIVLRKMAANVRLNKMASKDEQFSFSWKVFNSWDYMVGHAETANNKYAAITTTFKESIREVEEKQKVEKRTLLIFLRTVGCLLTLGLLCASGYLTYLVVMESSSNANPDQNFFELNKTTWVITAIFIVFPNFFDVISTMEQYHPRTNLRVQLARVFILNFLNVLTLMYSLYEKIIADNCSPIRVNTTIRSKSSETDLQVKSRMTLTQSTSVWSTALFNSSISEVTPATLAPHVMECKPFRCWETYVGQEVFKITVLDLLLTIIMILLQDFLRGLFVRFCNCCWCWNLEKTFPEYAEFKTAENILHLINNQGMIWLGWFFSPGISVMNLVKLIVLAYVRFWSVLVCNVPEKRIFRASRSNNFYYALLLIMLFICCIPSMIVFFNKYSQDCGPFRDTNDIMELLVQNLPFVAEILKFASKPATSLILLGSFSLIIYYLWSTSQSVKDVNRELKKTLEYERTEGKKKVYAMADAKRARETAVEIGREPAMTTTVSSQIKDEIKPLDMNVNTLTKRTFEGSRTSNATSAFHLSGESENSSGLTNKETKSKPISEMTTSNLKQLTLRSAMKEAKRLQQETQLGVIKLAKLKKFQLDREIKEVEKRILRWTERSSKARSLEMSSRTLVCSESQLNTPRSQKTLPDNSERNKPKNNRSKKNQTQAGVCEPIVLAPDVTARCSQEVSGQRKTKRLACRDKWLSIRSDTIKIGRGKSGGGGGEGEGATTAAAVDDDDDDDDDDDSADDGADNEVSVEELELDVIEKKECAKGGTGTRYPAPQRTRRGYDNHGFVDTPGRSRRKDVSQKSTLTSGNMLNISDRSMCRQQLLLSKSPDSRHNVASGEKRTMGLDRYHSDEHLRKEDEEYV